MTAFTFELVSPEKLIFSGDVAEAVVPGTEGDFTVLKDHAPVISALRPGILSYKGDKGAAESLYIRGGFADVSLKGLTILADHSVPVADVTNDLLDAEIKLAADALAAAKSEDAQRLAAERLAQIETLKTTWRS